MAKRTKKSKRTLTVNTIARRKDDGKAISYGGEALDLLTNPLAFVGNKVSGGRLNKNELSFGLGQAAGVVGTGVAAGLIFNPVTGVAVGAGVLTGSILRTKGYRDAVADAAKFVGRQIKRGAKFSWNSVIVRVWGWICEAAKAFGRSVKWIWNTIVVGMWDRLKEFGSFVKDSYTSAHDTLKTAYNTAR